MNVSCPVLRYFDSPYIPATVIPRSTCFASATDMPSGHRLSERDGPLVGLSQGSCTPVAIKTRYGIWRHHAISMPLWKHV